MENKSNHNGNDTESEFPPIFVGQVLYCLEHNGVLYCAEHNIKELIVAKIGKKYFYLQDRYKAEKYDSRYPIDKKTLKYTNKEYPQSNFQLYRSKQEILDIREKQQLIDLLRKYFNQYGKLPCTLQQLREVYAILQQGDGNIFFETIKQRVIKQ